MKSLPIFLFLVVLSVSSTTAFITPTEASSALVPVPRQELDLYASSKRLIERLVESLRNAANEARQAIVRFTAGIQEEAKNIQEKVINDIQKLRTRIAKTIEGLRNRLIDSGVAITDCISSHNDEANAIFNTTLSKTKACVDDRITDVGAQISTLRTMADNAVEYSNRAISDMKRCTQESENFMATGSCLGSVAVTTEMKALVFATQSGVTIGRINLSIATLPASLQVCAGARLLESGFATAKILMDIGTCSASSVFSTITGDASLQDESAWTV